VEKGGEYAVENLPLPSVDTKRQLRVGCCRPPEWPAGSNELLYAGKEEYSENKYILSGDKFRQPPLRLRNQNHSSRYCTPRSRSR